MCSSFPTLPHLFLHNFLLPFSKPLSFSDPLANALVHQFSSVQFSHLVMSDSATLWTTARQATQSITNSRSLLKLISIELVMLSNHLILCHPLPLLPSIFPTIRVFSGLLFIFYMSYLE